MPDGVPRIPPRTPVRTLRPRLNGIVDAVNKPLTGDGQYIEVVETAHARGVRFMPEALAARSREQIRAYSRIKLTTTTGDGTQSISTEDWRERLIHLRVITHWNQVPEDNTTNVADSGDGTNDIVWYGDNVGSAWATLKSYLVDTFALYFQVHGTTGNLRWSWTTCSGLGGDSYFLCHASAGPKQATNDYPAS